MSKEEWIVIHNVVASAAFNQIFDLKAITEALPLNAEYNPKIFPGVSFRMKKPKTCTLIFRTGKMVCTGAKSVRQVRRAIFKVARELKKGGIVMLPGKPEIRITNIVATVNLDGNVDLLAFYESERRMRGRVIYEPEQFPAIIYRMENPRVVLLIFSSGKLVCTGATKEEDVYEAAKIIQRRLEEGGFITKEGGASTRFFRH